MYLCDKCGNEYQSQYFFAVDGICNVCFQKMSSQEQQALIEEKGRKNPELTNAALESKRVGFGPRLGALVIDILILTTIILLVAFLTGDLTKLFSFDYSMAQTNPQGFQDELKEVMNPFTMKASIISIFYYAIEIFFAASIGKMILGYKIAEPDTKKTTLGKLGLRYILKNISTVFSIIGLATGIQALSSLSSLFGIAFFVGCFFVLGKAKLALHDIIAKTAVYRKEDVIEDTN